MGGEAKFKLAGHGQAVPAACMWVGYGRGPAYIIGTYMYVPVSVLHTCHSQKFGPSQPPSKFDISTASGIIPLLVIEISR